MGLKTLELTVISAKDLKNVNLIGKMDVYVVVKISGDPKSKQKTSVHQDGGTNPSWNYTMRFNIDEAAAQYGWFLEFDLRHETTFGGDKELGEVKVPLNELLDSVRGKDPHAPQFVTYQVRRSSGKSHGELKFSYKFTDVGQSSRSSSVYPPPVAAPYPHPPPQQPPTGYPMPPQQPPAGYPPPPTAVPYGAPGYPQHGGYGYAPAGYAAPPQAGYLQTQKPKKNNFGLGLGAGLIGGAIGGLVLGEVVDDAFDSGYDAGFDDSGGFDF